MNKKSFTKIILIVVVVIILSIASYFVFIKNSETTVQTQSPAINLVSTSTSLSTSTPTNLSVIEYKNNQYGFTFVLPVNWEGYSIITTEWIGYPLDVLQSDITAKRGPIISIRHPQWTSQNIRQDIPIMVFTVSQWNLLQQEKFHIGAAPINPSELGRNSRYIFAIPARYNYAFLIGYEEVEKILQNEPLQTF
ncbi:MAG: hypothetical protein PHN56_05890 [Candidatus Nanoarchaeia archaeon]|nr:hypothetical protein [Candidatus Nanoarchaeia archaeon]